MYKLKLSLLFTLLFSSNLIFCASLGPFDASFSQDGTTDGWDFISEHNRAYYGSDILIDSKDRIVVAGTYTFGEDNDIGLLIARYLPSGQLDLNFSGGGIMKLPFSHMGGSFKIKIKQSSFDNMFIGYTALGTTGNYDVNLLSMDETGLVLDHISVPFDLGTPNDRKDDFFADMAILTNIGGGYLIIAAEVERSTATDTDFGVAKVNFDSGGLFTLDTGFSSDGKNTCFHDHQAAGFSQDKATSVVITSTGVPVSSTTYFIGGSAFEGNGEDENGWNLAFCEFSTSGDIVKKWSTKSDNPGAVADSREELVDIEFGRSPQDGEYLLILSTEPETPLSAKNDFVLRKYISNTLNLGVWDLDINFADSGVSRIGFKDPYLFPETTNDIPSHINIDHSSQQILLAGTSYWQEGSSDKSYISLTKLKSNGLLNHNWGSRRTGKEYISLDTTTYSDILGSLAKKNGSGELYLNGTNFDFTQNTIKHSVANIAPDLMIFKNGFE